MAATDFHKLALAFLKETAAGGHPTLWFWRGAWYEWSGRHYQPISQDVVERKVLCFLKGKVAITASAIRGVVDLLRMLQSCNANLSPAWLHEDGGPDPKHLFPTYNGLLDIRDCGKPTLLSPTAVFWGLSSTEYLYDPSASCASWLKFLDELWGGGSQATSMLQEWFGYCLLPDTSQQKILAIIGPPRSGKSTVARVLTGLLGRSTVANPSIRSLSGNFGLWGLLDKSLTIIPDATLPNPCPALEELLKSISGEDSVDVHRKGMAPLTSIKLPTRLMLLANEAPAFRDPSRALEQRLIVLRTERSFFGREDVRLTDKLMEELPGILNWSIEGLERLRVRGRFLPRALAFDLAPIIRALPERERISRIVVSFGHRRRSRSNRPDAKRRKRR